MDEMEWDDIIFNRFILLWEGTYGGYCLRLLLFDPCSCTAVMTSFH